MKGYEGSKVVPRVQVAASVKLTPKLFIYNCSFNLRAHTFFSILFQEHLEKLMHLYPHRRKLVAQPR